MTDVPTPPSSSAAAAARDSKGEDDDAAAALLLLSEQLRSELSSLNRVSHRLAMTEAGPNFEKVIGLLLPRLLRRTGKNDDERRRERDGRAAARGRSNNNVNKRKTPDGVGSTSAVVDDDVLRSSRERVVDGLRDSIHDKLVETIGHVMKRVREDRSCALPCVGILESLAPPPPASRVVATSMEDDGGGGEDTATTIATTSNPLAVNLGLALLAMGIDRCRSSELDSILPGLLTFMARTIDRRPDDGDRTEGGKRTAVATVVGVGHLADPAGSDRHSRACRLVLRCLESSTSVDPRNGAVADAAPSTTSSSPGDAVPSHEETRRLVGSDPVVAAALFDLLVDVFLYPPASGGASSTTTTLVPSGLSEMGRMRLVGGGDWMEERPSAASIRRTKLTLLDLIAPCRSRAMFLPERGGDAGEGDGMGTSRTVALMVLLSGDTDPDVSRKADSYLRAHMDSHRGKDATRDDGGDRDASSADSLLGNTVALAQSLLTFAVGGASSMGIERAPSSQYVKSEIAVGMLGSRLGLTYRADVDDPASRKILLSCARMRISVLTAAPALKFVGKMLDDNPKLFHAGLDMEQEESDVAAVSIGTLALAVVGDLHRPGSSASSALGSAASLLNSLCVRLSLFYDSRIRSGSNVPASLERLRGLLARSLKQACAVLAPTSTGESASLASDGTRASGIQADIRDKCYGVVCSLSRSLFALDDRYALFDCGDSNERPAGPGSSFPLKATSTAALLFGCSSNEVEMLRPRATSALDALLGAKVRVVKLLAEKERALALERESASVAVDNPWASNLASVREIDKSKHDISMDGFSRSLLLLLWRAARRNQPKSSRLAAARWSSELLLRLDDSSAFHLLCFMSGDDDMTVSAIAKQALGVDKSMGEDNILSLNQNLPGAEKDGGDATVRVAFSVLMGVIVGSQSTINNWPSYSDFPVIAKAVTLRFLLQSLFSEVNFYADKDYGLALKKFVVVILGTLASYKGRTLSRDETDLIDECAIALASCTSTSKDARLVVAGRDGVSDGRLSYSDIAKQALTSNSSKSRRHLAESIGHLFEDHSIWNDYPSTDSLSISEWIERCGLAIAAESCHDKLKTMLESSFVVGEVHGSAFLGSYCVRAFRLAMAGERNDKECPSTSDCWEHCCSIVSLLGKGVGHSDVAIANSCSKGVAISFSYNDRDAPILSRRLFDAMAVAIDSMNVALKKYSSIDHADPTRVSDLVQAAGLLLAASTSGAGFTTSNEKENSVIDLGPARLQCTEALFGILGSKDAELSLRVGEALVKYSDALGGGEWSSGVSELKEGTYDESYAFGLPPHQHVLYTLFRREAISTNPIKRNSCASFALALVGHASRMANIDLSYIQRAFVQEMWKYLSLFQETFIKLLADPKSKHLSRESCCKGLAACRGLAAVMKSSIKVNEQSQIELLNDSLLKAFGQTTNYGGSLMQESESQASQRRNESEGNNDANGQDTLEVGGAAGMSEATLGAYREMASAALSLGQVDLLYSLMILSTNHPVWLLSDMRDRYSAKALLGKAEAASVEEIRLSLRSHLGKLIPKLLRACNDPNKQTRDQMNSLWLALTGGGSESRALVTQNLLPTIDTLIQDAGSKLWRARVGACGALADVIVGRSWQELGGGGIELDDEGIATKATASIRLLRLWRITMRSLDDVRTAVRERGDALGRGLRALTIRLCDPKATDSQESDIYLSNAQRKEREQQSKISAECAATVSLGWLVKYGLNQTCAEATGICVSCLLGIVDIAAPSTLQPVLAELIGSLLMAMSGLEPAALNYLQVRAAGDDANSQGTSYDQLERLRINLALSGPIAQALHKCLEMVKFVDLEAQKKLIPELDSCLRKGAGFATRAATADAVNSLCGKCPSAFSFPGSTMSNPTVRLLRAIYFASERERGITAKDKMTHALGSLATLAPGPAVRSLALKACERYCESSGSNNDPSIRKAAAATIRAIAVRASNHMADGGPKDVWVRKVLPVSFLGKHDSDATISSMWKDVWDEGGAAINSEHDGVFGVLLQEKLLPYIARATLSYLQSTSWANRKAGCAVLIDLAESGILAPIPRSTSDDSSSYGPDFDRLRQRARASSDVLSECVKIISRNRIWDGKGDVVKAGTLIAGKWSATAPIEESHNSIWPLLLRKDRHGDLFDGDDWFERSDEKGDDVDEEVGGDDTIDTVVITDLLNSEDDTMLDLKEDNDACYDEQINCENVETNAEKRSAQPVIFSGFCRVLLDQALKVTSNNATESALSYRVSALSGLTALLKSAEPLKDSVSFQDTVDHQRFIYSIVGPNLFSFISEIQTNNAPVLIARALECLAAAMYNGIGTDASQGSYADPVGLLKFFAVSTSKQPAWTVRQMSALAASSLVANMQSEILRRTDSMKFVLECSNQTLKDKKFWKVRLAGLELLLSLVSRVGNQKMSSTNSEKQLIMEAILPYKEVIYNVARKSLADSESQVTATASKITQTMAWWP